MFNRLSLKSMVATCEAPTLNLFDGYPLIKPKPAIVGQTVQGILSALVPLTDSLTYRNRIQFRISGAQGSPLMSNLYTLFMPLIAGIGLLQRQILSLANSWHQGCQGDLKILFHGLKTDLWDSEISTESVKPVYSMEQAATTSQPLMWIVENNLGKSHNNFSDSVEYDTA